MNEWMNEWVSEWIRWLHFGKQLTGNQYVSCRFLQSVMKYDVLVHDLNITFILTWQLANYYRYLEVEASQSSQSIIVLYFVSREW